MRRLFYVFALLMPVMSFATVDVSDCEVVGHQKGTMVEADCVTVASCSKDFARFPEDLTACLKKAKSSEECKQYIIEQNKKIEENNLVYRCPMNDLRLKQRLKTKTHLNHDLVNTYGLPMNQVGMGSDSQYVYLFLAKEGIVGFVNQHKYSIIGPAEKYGLNMAIFEE